MAKSQMASSPKANDSIHGRPHQRTMERLALTEWIEDFDRQDPLSTTAASWFTHRLCEELDRRRALERRWRKVFWSVRYIVLGGSLTLPAIITASQTVRWLNTVGILVSILVALATGADVLLRTGPKWRMYRQGADRLSLEATAFFQMLGPYSVGDRGQRLNVFQVNIEALIAEFQEVYLSDIDASVSQEVVRPMPDRQDR